MPTLQEALDKLESQPSVEDYLRGRGLIGPINNNRRSFTCPIAKYLTEELDEKCQVTTTQAFVVSSGFSSTLPDKVLEFRMNFDHEMVTYA